MSAPVSTNLSDLINAASIPGADVRVHISVPSHLLPENPAGMVKCYIDAHSPSRVVIVTKTVAPVRSRLEESGITADMPIAHRLRAWAETLPDNPYEPVYDLASALLDQLMKDGAVNENP